MDNIFENFLNVCVRVIIAKKPYYILYFMLWAALLIFVSFHGFLAEAVLLFSSSCIWSAMAITFYHLLTIPTQKDNKIHAVIKSSQKPIYWLLISYLIFPASILILSPFGGVEFGITRIAIAVFSFIYISIVAQFLHSKLIAEFLDRYETIEANTLQDVYSDVRGLMKLKTTK